MGYDWEFDGSVDFAPKHYRMDKYKECEELGKRIKDEKSAEEFLKAFKYIKYLSKGYKSEIYNWQTLKEYVELAYSMLKSKRAIFIWTVYPSQHKIWSQEFKHLRDTEQKVGKSISTSTYADYVFSFNKKYKKTNNEIKPYNRRHTLYWVKNGLLKKNIRKEIQNKYNDDNKYEILELYGVR